MSHGGIQDVVVAVGPDEPIARSVRGPGQVPNEQGAFGFLLTDLERLKRFLILGNLTLEFRPLDDSPNYERIAPVIQRLITSGKGLDALDLIKRTSVDCLNPKQEPLLYAYALFARCKTDGVGQYFELAKEVKKRAYGYLTDICRIPPHLFMFITFCEKISSSVYGQGSGWGRSHRRAIASWFAQYNDNPARLAYLVFKYNSSQGWKIKDVIRLTHVTPNTLTEPVRAILREVIGNRDSTEHSPVPEISQLVEKYKRLKQCERKNEVCSLISEMIGQNHKVAWEHLHLSMLKQPDVWEKLLPIMPIEALLRKLGPMTRHGVFPMDGVNEDTVIRRLDHLTADNIDEDNRRKWHPYCMFQALKHYKANLQRTPPARIPNENIIRALERAFVRSFGFNVASGKKVCLAVDVSHSMGQRLLTGRQGDSPNAKACQYAEQEVTCSEAAGVMAMITASVETQDNCVCLVFDKDARDMDIYSHDNTVRRLEEVKNRTRAGVEPRSDASAAIKWATENKISDVDAFVLYTNNQCSIGNVHLVQALKCYREFARNDQVKLIVCAMTSSKVTLAESSASECNVLNVVGFSKETPQVIQEFLLNEFH